MPFYFYGHLEAWIDAFSPAANGVRAALADVLCALVYLHNLGIVHCDVKVLSLLALPAQMYKY
jgi:serine/threonine protein kinase